MSALANTLQASASSSAALAAIAVRAAITPRQVALARAGKPINAGAYLALCGAAGVDPVAGAQRPVKVVSANVVWWLLSAALYIYQPPPPTSNATIITTIRRVVLSILSS
jgi:hypothetical protein